MRISQILLISFLIIHTATKKLTKPSKNLSQTLPTKSYFDFTCNTDKGCDRVQYTTKLSFNGIKYKGSLTIESLNLITRNTIYLFFSDNIPSQTIKIMFYSSDLEGSIYEDKNIAVLWKESKFKGSKGVIHPETVSWMNVEYITKLGAPSPKYTEFTQILMKDPRGVKINILDEVQAILFNLEIEEFEDYSNLIFVLYIIIMSFVSAIGLILLIGLSIEHKKHDTMRLVFSHTISFFFQLIVLIIYLIKYYTMVYLWCLAGFYLLVVGLESMIYCSNYMTRFNLKLNKKKVLVLILINFLMAGAMIFFKPEPYYLPFYFQTAIIGFCFDEYIYTNNKQLTFDTLYFSSPYLLPVAMLSYGEFYTSAEQLQEITKERFFFYIGFVVLSYLIIMMNSFVHVVFFQLRLHKKTVQNIQNNGNQFALIT